MFGSGKRRRSKLAWRAVAAGTAALAAFAARKSSRAAYRKAMDEDPPDNPAEPGVSWKQALTWTAGVALAGAVMRVVARRLSASGWEKATGERPPE